jgi:hypothetical protein
MQDNDELISEERCQSHMRTARLCDSMKRKIPGHILGDLARAERVWKNWPNVPQQVRDATRLYWDVENRTRDAMS